MTGRLVTPIDAAMQLGSEQYMLRFVQKQLPPPHEATTMDVLSGRTKLHVPGTSNPSLNAFLAQYMNNPRFRVSCQFSYVSTGLFADKGAELGDGIRRFLEHAKEDIACPVIDISAEILEEFKDCDFIPTTRDLFLAGAALARLNIQKEMLLDDTADWQQLRSCNAGVQTCCDSIRKRMAFDIDLRSSLFFVSEKEQGPGPMMEIGRKSEVSCDDKEFSYGEEVHSILNPIKPESGHWYKIPAVPFAVYPGIIGWRIRHALTKSIDDELAHVLARKDQYAVTPEQVEGSVKMRTVVAPDAEGMFRSTVHKSRSDGPGLEQVTISSNGYPPVNVEVSGNMAFIVPLQGRLSVKSTVIRPSGIHNHTYKIEPGGGAILLSPENFDDETVEFSVRAHERSSFLIYQPELFEV